MTAGSLFSNSGGETLDLSVDEVDAVRAFLARRRAAGNGSELLVAGMLAQVLGEESGRGRPIGSAFPILDDQDRPTGEIGMVVRGLAGGWVVTVRQADDDE